MGVAHAVEFLHGGEDGVIDPGFGTFFDFFVLVLFCLVVIAGASFDDLIEGSVDGEGVILSFGVLEQGFWGMKMVVEGDEAAMARVHPIDLVGLARFGHGEESLAIGVQYQFGRKRLCALIIFY